MKAAWVLAWLLVGSGFAGATATAPDAALPAAEAITQRALLYEGDRTVRMGRPATGSITWHVDAVPPAAGAAPRLALRGVVALPERRLAATLTFRRNNDRSLPASHVIDMTFEGPADSRFGGIADVRGLSMKPAEALRGAPLAALSVMVAPGAFLVALPDGPDAVRRNLRLLKERAWIDVPIVYANGRRGILALEKDRRAFEQAFQSWGA